MRATSKLTVDAFCERYTPTKAEPEGRSGWGGTGGGWGMELAGMVGIGVGVVGVGVAKVGRGLIAGRWV